MMFLSKDYQKQIPLSKIRFDLTFRAVEAEKGLMLYEPVDTSLVPGYTSLSEKESEGRPRERSWESSAPNVSQPILILPLSVQTVAPDFLRLRMFPSL
jgi:hypothetical protein